MEQPIIIPSEARKHFDEQAELLIRELKPTNHRELSHSAPPTGSLGEIPIVGNIDADQITNLEISIVDGLGNFRGFIVHGEGVQEVFPRESAGKFIKLVKASAKSGNLDQYCSSDYLHNHLVNWIRNRRLNEDFNKPWTEELINSLQDDIDNFSILLPLEGLCISSPFKLGKVKFGYFTKSWLDHYLRNLPPGPESEAHEQKIRKQYQGRVYTEYQCKAESTFAGEKAREHTDRVLDVLRMFHPAAIDVDVHCFLGQMGQIVPENSHGFRVSNKGIVQKAEALKHEVEFNVDARLLKTIGNSGIGKADELFRKDVLSEFEKDVLEALRHFAHGIMSPYPQDRILNAFVSIESLLIQNLTEPVQSSLSYRVAILTEGNFDDRKKAAKEITEGYSLRSQFVHHGIKPEDIAIANTVLFRCWKTLNNVMSNVDRFRTRHELIKILDDHKYRN